MSTLAHKYKPDRLETILSFVWHHWSRIGGTAAGGQDDTRIVDPEPLLLLTLQVGRQDPRMFDAVLDWLVANGKWMNVVRLTTLLERDKVCEPQILGAVAAVMAQHDRTPKWRTLAKRLKPDEPGELEALFQKKGRLLTPEASQADPIFKEYGYLREPVGQRSGVSPVLNSRNPAWTAAEFMFRARALFGVNIRADAFSYLALHRVSNPTRMAKELGYSQRRVQDALVDMAASGLFKARTVGRSKEYVFEASGGWSGIIGDRNSSIEWYDWRALARALSTIWKRLVSVKEERASEYILTSEEQKALQDVRDDLVAAEPGWQGNLKETLTPPAGYGWKRLWRPRDGQPARDSRGYPSPPSADWPIFMVQETEARYLDEIDRIRCLVLLGEPGMGKSYALNEQRKQFENRLEREGSKSLFLDLRSCGSEEQIVRNLFESEIFASWERGEHDLHLFLDSLDEALLHKGVIAALLAERFRALPSVTGLFLRIACRTADWPSTLNDGLRDAWGEEHVAVYELVELTRQDVVKAARSNGIDSEAFLAQVDEREVAALAMKPVTLNFLSKAWRDAGQLSATQSELYAEGCRLLCEESNESRLGAKLMGKLTAGQRMDIASHIAAATIFCNRSSIWTGASSLKAPKEALTMDELCSGTAGPNQTPVTQEAVRETLNTGLFSGRGPDRLGWAHQTYAEFLAARYLVQCGASAAQIMGLLTHRGDTERKLTPQLHETAAWIAGMDKAVFREIMATEPAVLLGSDIATASNEDRRQLVEAILTLYEQQELFDHDWSLSGRYRKLNHTGLADQLRPWIMDRGKDEYTRQEALDIARACDPKPLVPNMLVLALEPTEEISVRTRAAAIIADHGDQESRRRLKPLALGTAGPDPKQELKGIGLTACWPDYLSAKELFSTIGPPANPSYYGHYRQFLSQHLIQHVKPDVLPIALDWVARQQSNPMCITAAVADQVINLAVGHADDEGILSRLAEAILGCWEYCHYTTQSDDAENWRKKLAADRSLRRKLALRMFQTVSAPERESMLDAILDLRLIDHCDVRWLLEILECEHSAEARESIVQVLSWNVRPPNLPAEDVDALLKASEKHEIIHQALGWLLDPIELASERANHLRTSSKRQRNNEAKRKARQNYRLEPSPAKRVGGLLTKIDAGNPELFWLLVREMTLEETSMHYGDDFKVDLTDYPGWKNADSPTRERILSAAREYLKQMDATTGEWFSQQNIVHRPACAGVKALHLLYKEDPAEFGNLDPDVWSKWMPIVLKHPTFDNQDAYRTLAQHAFESAPDSAIEWLPRVIAKENDESANLSVLNRIDPAWDQRIIAILFEKLTHGSLKPQPFGQVLELLLAQGHDETRQFARAQLRIPLSEDPDERALTLVVCENLMKHCRDAAWDIIWPAMAEDARFGRALIERIAYKYHLSCDLALSHLTEEQVADLFIWMNYEFPPENDPPEPTETIETEGDRRRDIKHFRNAMLSHLKNRGTTDSVEAMEKLRGEFPAYTWLKRLRADARSVTRRRTWQPLKPEEFFRVIKDHELRIVQGGEDLLELVTETLRKLEQTLQGETAMARFLWDKVPGGKSLRPKEENDFSDYVKNFLHDNLSGKGVVVNREVEIRRGEKTDIHVEAFVESNGRKLDQVTVIVEVKGCWNRGLDRDMEGQLAGRYLKDNPCQHGVYLVGWFHCDQWDDADYRKQHAARISRDHEELRRRLDSQAGELSKSAKTIRAFVLNAALR